LFNCLRNLAPSYLMNMCQPVTNNLHRRRLHFGVRGGLIVPPTKTVRYDPCSFAVTGQSTWNALLSDSPQSSAVLNLNCCTAQCRRLLTIGVASSHVVVSGSRRRRLKHLRPHHRKQFRLMRRRFVKFSDADGVQRFLLTISTQLTQIYLGYIREFATLTRVELSVTCVCKLCESKSH